MDHWEAIIYDEQSLTTLPATLLAKFTIYPTYGQEKGDMWFDYNHTETWLANGAYSCIRIYKNHHLVYKKNYNPISVAGGNVLPFTIIIAYASEWVPPTHITPGSARAAGITRAALTGSISNNALVGPMNASNTGTGSPNKIWELMIENTNNQPILCQIVDPVPSSVIGCDVQIQIPANTSWIESGTASRISLLCDGTVAAQAEATPYSVLKGTIVPRHSYVFFYSSQWKLAPLAQQEPVCDCGGDATYGKDANLHENSRFFVCSLRKAGR